jgi:hypothetical protein
LKIALLLELLNRICIQIIPTLCELVGDVRLRVLLESGAGQSGGGLLDVLQLWHIVFLFLSGEDWKNDFGFSLFNYWIRLFFWWKIHWVNERGDI